MSYVSGIFKDVFEEKETELDARGDPRTIRWKQTMKSISMQAAGAAATGLAIGAARQAFSATPGSRTLGRISRTALLSARDSAAISVIQDLTLLSIDYATDSHGLLNEIVAQTIGECTYEAIQSKLCPKGVANTLMLSSAQCCARHLMGRDDVILNTRLPDKINAPVTAGFDVARSFLGFKL